MLKKLIFSDKKFKIALFYLFIFAFCIIAGIDNSTIDPDFFSRLIMGHHIFHNGSVMYNDIVSYTPTHTWYDHEWLSSFFFYIVLKYSGIVGILSLKVIILALTVSLIDLAIVLRQNKFFYKYKSLYLFFVLALFIHIKFFHSLRCQNFTFLFIPLLIIILEKYRKNIDTKIIYFIPVLMLLWLNMHGGSMYGIAIIMLFIAGEFISKKPVNKLIIILILSCLVYLINPWGFDFIGFLLQAVPADRTYIGEWQTPFRMEPYLVLGYILIQIFIVSAYLYSQFRQKVNFKTFDYTKFFLILTFMFMSLRYIKHSVIYFLAISILFYEDMKIIFDDLSSLIKKIAKKTISYNWLYLLFCPVYIGYFCYVLSNYNLTTIYNRTMSNYPAYALQFLADNNIKGKVFAPYYVGGYIAYKCYPDLKIYMDGRQEQVYSQEIFNESMEFFFLNKENAHFILAKYPPDIIIVEKYWRANYYLESFQNYYKKVYDQGKFNLYLAPNVQRFNYVYPESIEEFSEENYLKSKYFN